MELNTAQKRGITLRVNVLSHVSSSRVLIWTPMPLHETVGYDIWLVNPVLRISTPYRQ